MIAMAITGVLRDPSSSEVIPAGRTLYRALAGSYGLVLLVDEDVKKDSLWLTAQGFNDHNFLSDSDGRRRAQLQRMRQRGSVEMVIESDPEMAAETVAAGYTVLFFAAPSYATPDHLPGTRLIPAPWGVLLEEVERQAEIKASDTRSQEIL